MIVHSQLLLRMMSVDGLDLDLRRFDNLYLFIGQVVDDSPVIEHVGRGHEVLHEGEYAKGPIVAMDSVSVEEVGHEEEAGE